MRDDLRVRGGGAAGAVGGAGGEGARVTGWDRRTADGAAAAVVGVAVGGALAVGEVGGTRPRQGMGEEVKAQPVAAAAGARLLGKKRRRRRQQSLRRRRRRWGRGRGPNR